MWTSDGPDNYCTYCIPPKLREGLDERFSATAAIALTGQWMNREET
jgi:hypothetical protein